MKNEYNVVSDMRGESATRIVNQILKDRGIKNKKHFLNPTEEDLLPLTELKNIDIATEIILDGIEKELKFHVFMDSDTDGATSGTIAVRGLRNHGANVTYSINEGKRHGLRKEILDDFDCDILIIPDSLDSTIDNYKYLSDKGIKIIVCDHHDVLDEIPYENYITLVSSNKKYGNKELSGAGVMWKVIKYLDVAMDTKYADGLADLACTGIIADVSDMTSMENRYIAKLGFDNLVNPFIKKVVGSYEFNSTAISFSIASLINAANRIGKNDIAMEAFLCDDKKQVGKLLKELQECKDIQNEEVDGLLQGVMSDFDSQEEYNVLYTVIESQYGVSGLIGNKMLDKYNKPLLILQKREDENGVYYAGSGRAVGTKSFKDVCLKSGKAELGGHPNAFGISRIEQDDLEDFISYARKELSHLEFCNTVNVDILLDEEDVTRQLVDKIKELDKISGKGFKPVQVMIEDIARYDVGSFKQGKHLVLYGDNVTAIQWNTPYTIEEFEDHALFDESVSVVGTLDSGFLARKFMLKLIINDIEVSE